MNNIFTHRKTGNFTIKFSYFTKRALACTAALISVCNISVAKNTDLHNPDAYSNNGRILYRFLQTDINGTHSYSNIVMINMSISNASIDIYPNPARSFANFNLYNLPEKNNPIIGFDITGKAVMNNINVTGNTVKLNVAASRPGTNLIKVFTVNGNVFQNKMTVVN